jgi:hypothetical protein
MHLSDLQEHVRVWVDACFGAELANDKHIRNVRFLEEACELVQACDCTAEQAHAVVDYVFKRKQGKPEQELQGALTTLTALCLANNLDMRTVAYVAMNDCWARIDQIREKNANKPSFLCGG